MRQHTPARNFFDVDVSKMRQHGQHNSSRATCTSKLLFASQSAMSFRGSVPNVPDTQSSPPQKTPSPNLPMHVGVGDMCHVILRTKCLSQHGYGQQQHRKGRPTWWIPGWAPGRRAAAAPATSTRLSGPACENKLGPKTFLERRGSSCNAGCPEDQPPSNPFLRPFRTLKNPGQTAFR